MRIVIDLQGAQTESRFRGIGRYSLSIAKAIARNRGQNDVIIVLSGLFPNTIIPICEEFENILPQSNIRIWKALGPVEDYTEPNQLRRNIAKIIYSHFIEKLKPDIFYITSIFEHEAIDYNNKVNNNHFATIITLYDLIPLNNPDKYLSYDLYRNFYMQRLTELKSANGLVAISEFSRYEGLKSLGISEARIIDISSACDDIFKKINNPDVAELTKFGIKQHFILYTGGADVRKNIQGLIKAYALLPKTIREQYQLVLAGRMKSEEKLEIKKTTANFGVKESEYLLTDYVSDNDLVLLYNQCSLFVFPSFYEGFGLPALEAINCGTPVIASNVTSIPEVIGCPDALFDPQNIAQIALKIKLALTNSNYKTKIMRQEQENSSKFSWDHSANSAIAFFNDIIEFDKCNQHLFITHKEQKNIDHNIISDISKIDGIDKLSDIELQNTAVYISENYETTA